MAFEIAFVFLGAAVVVALAVFAGSRSYLGRRLNRGAGVNLAFTPGAPVTGQAKAVAPAASWFAPSPSPARYETVQPNPGPQVAQASSSSWTTLGASTPSPRRATSYKRRTIPTRSTVTKDQAENSSG